MFLFGTDFINIINSQSPFMGFGADQKKTAQNGLFITALLAQQTPI